MKAYQSTTIELLPWFYSARCTGSYWWQLKLIVKLCTVPIHGQKFIVIHCHSCWSYKQELQLYSPPPPHCQEHGYCCAEAGRWEGEGSLTFSPLMLSPEAIILKTTRIERKATCRLHEKTPTNYSKNACQMAGVTSMFLVFLSLYTDNMLAFLLGSHIFFSTNLFYAHSVVL
jgi:hypothetical protein